MGNIQQILDESINFELDAYNMYHLFSETFENDSEFWKTLAEEELNHTSVLRKIKQFYQGDSKIIDIISIKDINFIKQTRRHLKKLFTKFKENPTQKMACKIGLEIEKSFVEKNYQKFMSKVTDDGILHLFQSLNGDEKDHFKRIQKYFQDKT